MMNLNIAPSRKFYLLLILIFSVSLLGLGAWGLTESSEARYAEISREMLIDDDFVHPRLLEIQHYHKPPLTYQISALGYKIFGINEFGARFFLQIALLLQVFLTYRIGLLLFKREKIALLASIIYFSFPIVLMASNNLTTDAYLTTFVIMAIYSWLLYRLKSKIFGLYLAAIALGLGFLTKGPVVLLPFLVFIGTYTFYKGRRMKFNIHSLLAALLFLGVSASWFILVIREIPELWNYFFETHTIERALNAQDFNRDKPFWYFFAYSPLVGIPWFFFFLVLLVRNLRKKDKIDPVVKMLILNTGIVLLAFSLFSSKLVLYVLPLYLYVALASAFFIQKASGKILRAFTNSYRILFLLIAVAVSVALISGRIEIQQELIYLLLFLLITGLVVMYFKGFRSRLQQLISISLLFAAILLGTFRIVANQNPYLINSTKSLAGEIKQIQDVSGKTSVAVFDNRLSALPFYLDQKTVNIHRDKFETRREVLFEEKGEYLRYYWDINEKESLDELIRFLKEDRGIFIAKDSKEFRDSIDLYLQNMQVKHSDKWDIYY